MRYVIAFVLAVLLVAAGFVFVSQTRRATVARIAQARAEAGLTDQNPGGEISGESNAAILSDFGMEISRGEMYRIQIADLLSRFAMILVPLVFVVCLGVAAIIRSKPVSKA